MPVQSRGFLTHFGEKHFLVRGLNKHHFHKLLEAVPRHNNKEKKSREIFRLKNFENGKVGKKITGLNK